MLFSLKINILFQIHIIIITRRAFGNRNRKGKEKFNTYNNPDRISHCLILWTFLSIKTYTQRTAFLYEI